MDAIFDRYVLILSSSITLAIVEVGSPGLMFWMWGGIRFSLGCGILRVILSGVRMRA